MGAEHFFPEGRAPLTSDDRHRSILKWASWVVNYTPAPSAPVTGTGLEQEGGLLIETETGEVIEVT